MEMNSSQTWKTGKNQRIGFREFPELGQSGKSQGEKDLCHDKI